MSLSRRAFIAGLLAAPAVARLPAAAEPDVLIAAQSSSIFPTGFAVWKSVDGGATWSSQRTASIGQMGELQRQMTFRRIGTTKRHGIVFELSASAAVMRGFLGMAIDADKLAA